MFASASACFSLSLSNYGMTLALCTSVLSSSVVNISFVEDSALLNINIPLGLCVGVYFGIFCSSF